MPYEENRDLFPVPLPDSEIIWRFMDFAKFMALLEDKALYFCRSDRLGDDFEGHYSKPRLKTNVTYLSADSPPRHYYNVGIDEQETIWTKQRNAELRKRVFINCWNWKDYESYSLWRLYSANKGVAIQSTIGRLKNSLSTSSEHVQIGPVTYIDWDEQGIPLGNSLYPFIHKRNNFESEHEVRALYCDFHNKHDNELGINIPINLEILLEKVYIYPMSSQWHYDLIESIVKRYNLNIKVKTSKLSERPED